MGAFPYPYGFAGTKRVQQYIDFFNKQGIPVEVLSLMGRAGLPGNEQVEGFHNGVPYRVIGRDLKAGLHLPLALVRYVSNGCQYFRARRDAGSVNILFHYGQPAGENILFLLYARKLGFRIIHDLVEDYDLLEGCRRSLLFNFKIRLMKKLSRTIPALSDGLVVISRCLEQKYKGCGLPMVRIPIAAEVPEAVPKKIRNNPVRIAYAGTFAPKDGIHILLEAYQRVRRDYPNCMLCLAGGRESPLNQLPPELTAGVEYAGYLDDAAFYRFLNEADILCMTRMNSAFANAGFPFKLGEYLATGNPVVASRVSNLDEYLTDKHDVILVEPESVQELSDALLYLLRNPERARQIGINGFAACAQYFNPEKNGRDLLGFIKQHIAHNENAEYSRELTMKHKNRVLITLPDLTRPGGVANYYRTIRPYLPECVQLLSIGQRLADRPLKKLMRPLIDLGALLRSVPKADLVHVNPSLGCKGLIRDAVTLSVARLLRKKTMVFFRGWDLGTAGRIQKTWLPLFRFFYLRADVILVLASDFEQTLRRWGYSGSVVLETTTVDDSYQNLAEERQSVVQAVRDLKVLLMARLVEGKGVMQSVDAIIQLVRQHGVPVSLNIAGDGPVKTVVEKRIRDEKLSCIRLAGHLSDEVKKAAFRDADVFLFPTVYGEGMPNVILEAMVAGLPVITTPVGGTKDFFEAGKMGFLVDGNSVEQITEALKKIFEDPSAAKQMGAYNAEYGKKCFCASKVAARLMATYSSVLGRG